MKRKFLDEYQACNYLSCSRPTLHKRIKAGLLRSVNIEGTHFFRVADLKKFKVAFTPPKAGRKRIKKVKLKKEVTNNAEA